MRKLLLLLPPPPPLLVLLLLRPSADGDLTLAKVHFLYWKLGVKQIN